MASVTLEGSKYKYTMTIPSPLNVGSATCNKYLSEIFTPVITRSSTGTAITRYFYIGATFANSFNYMSKDYSMDDSGEYGYALATYKAVFAANSKSSTVTAMSNTSVFDNIYGPYWKIGILAVRRKIGKTPPRFFVEASTQYNDDSWFDFTYSAYSLDTTAMTPTLSFSGSYDPLLVSNKDSAFGFVQGYATAQAQVTSASSYTIDYPYGSLRSSYTLEVPTTKSILIYRHQNSTPVAGDETLIGSSTYSTTGASTTKSLSSTIITSPYVSARSTAYNTLCGSTNAVTITSSSRKSLQAYTPPEISSVRIVRSGTNQDGNNATLYVDYLLHSLNNTSSVGSTVNVKSVVVNYTITQNNTQVTTGSITIAATGSSANLSGTVSKSITGDLFDLDKTYTVNCTVNDRLSVVSSASTAILAPSFFTLDFKDGGKGIGVGTASTRDGFIMGMESYLQMDSSGTLYDYIYNTLDWESSTVVDGINLNMRLFIEKMINAMDTLSVPGSIKMFAGPIAKIPNGWLLCDGKEYSISTYPRLNAALGGTSSAGATTWGTPTSGYFKVPDLRGRTIIGVNNSTLPNGATSSLSTRDIGTQNIGSENAITPYHNHSVSAVSNAITGGSHSHETQYYTYATSTSGTNRRFGPYAASASGTAVNTSSETHTHNLPAHNTNYTGTDATGANMQPSAVVNFIIFTGKY